MAASVFGMALVALFGVAAVGMVLSRQISGLLFSGTDPACSSTASDATPTSAANVRVGAVAAEEFAGVELVMMVLRGGWSSVPTANRIHLGEGSRP